jgi:TetR/AcrR family transcriptional regulator, cholesterol catabolism regulator
VSSRVKRRLSAGEYVDASCQFVSQTVLNEARWSEIVDTASEVFAAKGYEATTVQDIASRVGLLKGSLYYYIQSKEDLLFAVLERAYAHTISWVREQDAPYQGHDAATRLCKFIERWMENLDRESTSMKLDREIRYLSPAHTAAIAELAAEIESVLADILAKGVAEGTFADDTDVSVAVNTILPLLNSTAAWYRPTGRLSWNEISSWYQSFILRGLAADPVAQAD